MNQQDNFENQNLNQDISPNIPQKNNYKILFFVSFGLFLITASVLATLIITQKFSQPIQTTDTQETEVTPIETTKTNSTGDSVTGYVGKTPFDPEKIKVGDTVFNGMVVADKTTNKNNYIKVHLVPNTDGSGDFIIFDKNNKVVCEGLPCCDETSKGIDAIWQDEWCLGY